MPPFITYLIIAFGALYVVIILVELAVFRAFKRFLVEILILFVFVVILNVTTGFPAPRQAFGGVSPLAAIGIMFICTSLGIAARYVFYMRVFTWRSFLKPLVISPIVLLPLIGSVQGSANIESIQLISFGILAFQNGFFWKVILERTQLQIKEEASSDGQKKASNDT